jgi:hypothetical protein
VKSPGRLPNVLRGVVSTDLSDSDIGKAENSLQTRLMPRIYPRDMPAASALAAPLGLIVLLVIITAVAFTASILAGLIAAGITLVVAGAAVLEASQDTRPPSGPPPPGADADFGDSPGKEVSRDRALEQARFRWLRHRRP